MNRILAFVRVRPSIIKLVLLSVSGAFSSSLLAGDPKTVICVTDQVVRQNVRFPTLPALAFPPALVRIPYGPLPVFTQPVGVPNIVDAVRRTKKTWALAYQYFHPNLGLVATTDTSLGLGEELQTLLSRSQMTEVAARRLWAFMLFGARNVSPHRLGTGALNEVYDFPRFARRFVLKLSRRPTEAAIFEAKHNELVDPQLRAQGISFESGLLTRQDLETLVFDRPHPNFDVDDVPSIEVSDALQGQDADFLRVLYGAARRFTQPHTTLSAMLSMLRQNGITIYRFVGGLSLGDYFTAEQIMIPEIDPNSFLPVTLASRRPRIGIQPVIAEFFRRVGRVDRPLYEVQRALYGSGLEHPPFREVRSPCPHGTRRS